MKSVKFSDNKSLMVDLDVFASFLSSSFWSFSPQIQICSDCGDFMQHNKELPDHCLKNLYNMNHQQVLMFFNDRDDIERLYSVLEPKELKELNQSEHLQLYVARHMIDEFRTDDKIMHLLTKEELLGIYEKKKESHVWDYLITHHQNYTLHNYNGEEIYEYIEKNLHLLDLNSIPINKLNLRQVVWLWKFVFESDYLELQDFMVTAILINIPMLPTLSDEELEPILTSKHFSEMLSEREIWHLLYYSRDREVIVTFCFDLLQHYIVIQKYNLLWDDERIIVLIPWIHEKNPSLSYLILNEIADSDEYGWILSDKYSHQIGNCLDEMLAEKFLSHPLTSTSLRHYCLQCINKTELYQRKKRKLL